MSKQLTTNFAGIRLRNPILLASGIVGFGDEYRKLINFNHIGGLVTKTITVLPRIGNPPPRICETESGMLNSIGLENPGLEMFIKNKVPTLAKLNTYIIVSIAGDSKDEYIELIQSLDKIQFINGFELNLSCPNVRHIPARRYTHRFANRLISQDSKIVANYVATVRKFTSKPLIAKLTPNVTDITEIALSVERAGADAVCIANSFPAMDINISTRQPKLANIVGGLSGPGIRPVILKMVWDCYQVLKIPILGCGGINSSSAAISFFLAGASAISVGSGIFANPDLPVVIKLGLQKYLNCHKLSLKRLIGNLHKYNE